MQHFYKLSPFSMVLLTCLQSSAQDDPGRDSSLFYQGELADYWRRVYDSARNTEEYRAILDRANRTIGSVNYSGTSLITGVSHSSLGALNRQLAADGFRQFGPVSALIGFGFSFRNDRLLTDFSICANSIRKTKKGAEEYRLGGGYFARLDFGYNFLTADKVALYPYAGIGLRSVWLRYNRPVDVAPGGGSLANMFTTHEILARSTRAGYAAGIGADWQIAGRNRLGGAVYLFLKAGVTGSFGGEKFKVEEARYRLDIRAFNSEAMVGLKFVRRR